MHLSLSNGLCVLAMGHTALAAPSLSSRASLDSWLEGEASIALSRILANIGSAGVYATSADSGVIIASPSTDSPNCTS